MYSLENLSLGKDNERIRLSTREENRCAVLALASQARRTIDIFSWDLEPDLYDDPPFIEAIKQLAIGSRRAQIRILLQDSTRAVKRGHRLPYIAQRIPSKIAIRKPSHEYKEYHQSLLISDGIGILRRPSCERFEGELNFKDPMQAKEQLNFFNKLWESSETDPYLKRLHI